MRQYPVLHRSQRRVHIAMGWAFAMVGAGTAMAQQAPDPATAPSANVAAPAATPADAAAGAVLVTPPASVHSQAAAEREDVEQVARIAGRRIENLEEQLTAKAKETPVVQADDKAFLIKSADAGYTLRFFALLQADSRWFFDDNALSDRSDTFLIRKFRPGIGGTLFKFTDFRFTPELAGGTATVLDGYLDFHPAAWIRLRVGKFKTPLGLERLQSDASLPFLERALTQNLTPQRDVGATLWGEIAGGLFRYDLGVFNGAPDGTSPDVDANHAKDFEARLLLQPFKTESLKDWGSLGIHFAASTGNRWGTQASPQLPSFRSGGQLSIFSYLTTTAANDPTGAGTAIAHFRQTRLNPGLYYYKGGLGILTEVVQSRQRIQKGDLLTDITHHAGHVTLSYAFNAFNSYEGAAPITRFDPAKGTWGAVEVAVRANYLQIDDAVFGNVAEPANTPQLANPLSAVSGAAGGGVALTWIPSLTTRFAVNFEQTRFSGGATGPDKTVVDRRTENVLITRAQVAF